MAITFGGSVLGTVAGSIGTVPITIAGANPLLVVTVNTRNTGGTIIRPMTFAGQNLTTAVVLDEAGAENSQDEIFYLQNPPIGLGTILGTTSANASKFVASYWNGALTTADPLAGTITSEATTGTIAGTLTPSEGSCVVISTATHESSTDNTAGTGITVLRNVDEGVWQTSSGYNIDSGAGGATIMLWTNGNSDNWGQAIAAFKSAPTEIANARISTLGLMSAG